MGGGSRVEVDSLRSLAHGGHVGGIGRGGVRVRARKLISSRECPLEWVILDI